VIALSNVSSSPSRLSRPEHRHDRVLRAAEQVAAGLVEVGRQHEPVGVLEDDA